MSSIGSSRPRGPAGGQLSGLYPAPNVAGMIESGGSPLTFGPIEDGDVLMRQGNEIAGGIVSAYDELVRVSSQDDFPGYLSDKLSVNLGLTCYKVNPGNDEQWQVSVVNFSSTAAGAVPASGGGTITFLRADGTWAIPSGTGNTYFPGGW